MKTNFDDLLVPISEEQPTGRNTEYEQIYDDIRQARESDPDYLPQGEWATKLRKADWGKVVCLSRQVLKLDSKDLQVACWLVEGLAQQQGLSGLQQGCEFLAVFIQRYWQHGWPELDEDGAVIRHSMLNRLDRQLTQLLNVYPLMGDSERTLDHWRKVLLQAHQPTMKADREHANDDFSMDTFNRWVATLAPQNIATQRERLNQLVERLDALEATYADINPQADSYVMEQTRSVIVEMQDFIKQLFDRTALVYEDVMSLNVLTPQEEAQPAKRRCLQGKHKSRICHAI